MASRAESLCENPSGTRRVEAAITTTMVSGIIAVAGASGLLLAYLQFNDQALAFVTSLSKNPTVVLLILDGVMIVHGSFVD